MDREQREEFDAKLFAEPEIEISEDREERKRIAQQFKG
jgi:hypothetical protein